ncbi:Inactive UDP-glycosyltransferase 79A6 [Glycine soja]|uniref:Inactive UDP-glycosyltransferase 79A6 n=1 Tax=Glycine soja TaxID=3848 RepID=A0A445IPT6_GLYSO|nr:Inactive UDP-glycosyltransferase 79A6 [Glycine soja]
MFPFLAFGHFNAFVQLSNKLFYHGVSITFLSAASNIPRIKSTLNLNPAITVIPLHLPNGITSTAELPPHLAGKLILAIDLTQSHVKSLLLELKPHYVFLDFAQNWLPKLASELEIKSVRFVSFSAISDSCINVPSRLAGVEGRNITFDDLKKPPPGYPKKSNISLKAFEAMDLMFLFKRFGEKNLTEVASGLELTGLPFVLVLNFPSNLSAKAELERALPKEFLERVKNRGLVHTALTSDCELVLLPFKADQFFNAKLIAKDLEAGIEGNRSEDGNFKKEDILKAVKTIMVEDDKEPGKHIKENHMKWKEFLSNKGIQNKFITDLVAQLKSIA